MEKAEEKESPMLEMILQTTGGFWNECCHCEHLTPKIGPLEMHIKGGNMSDE